MESNVNKETNLLDILIVIAKHKKFVIIVTFIASVFAVVYSLLTPEYWKSSVTFTESSSSMNMQSLPDNIMGIDTSSLLGDANQGKTHLIKTILYSRTFLEDFIKEYSLTEYFEIEDPDSLVVKEKTLRAVREELLGFATDEETGVHKLSVLHKDQFLAPAIANDLFSRLEKYLNTEKLTKSKRNRIFLEERIEELDALIDSLATLTHQFNQKENIVSLSQQSEMVIQLYAQLISEKMTKEIELQNALLYIKKDNFRITKLENELKILNERIKKVETEAYTKYVTPIDSVSELKVKAAKLEMNLLLQKEVYEFIYPRYEKARIDELNDSPLIEIIDSAVPAGLRAKPKRALICFVFFMLALVVSSVGVVIHDILVKDNQISKIKILLKTIFSR